MNPPDETARQANGDKRFGILTSFAPLGIYQTDACGKCIYVNERWCEMAGMTVEDALGEGWITALHPEDRERISCAWMEAIAAVGGWNEEYRFLAPDGRVTWIHGVAVPLRDHDGSIIGYLGADVDITEQINSQQALRESETRFRQLFESMTSGVAVYEAVDDGADFVFKAFNSSAERISRKPRASVLARKVSEVFPYVKQFGLFEVFQQVWRKGEPMHHPISWYEDDVLQFWVDNYVYKLPSGELVAIFDDVTQQKRAEEESASLAEELRQVQKLESLGRLTGGLAHDFNNLLTVINGYGEMVLHQLPADAPLRPALVQMLSAGERAADLTQQLLTFSRRQIVDVKPLDLNQIISGTVGMLRRLLGEDVNIELNLMPERGWIMADRTQLNQVLLNLAINARDAMPGGGLLKIETAAIEVDGGNAADLPGLAWGSYLRCKVSDTGCGISAEDLPRIFEPFFTTKGPGKGTGLGLSTVYGVVQQLGGAVQVESAIGEGVVFRIYLPRIDPPEKGFDDSDAEIGNVCGNETILVVEDEEGVRGLIEEMLKGFGYQVLTAADAAAALELERAYAGKIDLLLTDVVMPGKNGRDLTDEMRRVRPLMRVLFISGFPQEVIAHHGALDAGLDYLPKPFSAEALAAKVRSMLGGSFL